MKIDKNSKEKLLGNGVRNYDSIEKEGSTEIPQDKHSLVYIMFFIQGVGLLLPWNIFITAHEYFKYKFVKNKEEDNTFENAFSVSAEIPCTLALFINLYLTGKISRTVRMFLCLIVTLMCFLTTDIFVYINTSSWTESFFVLTIVLVIIINLCAGILQGTMFGITGLFGPRYIQSTLVGMSIGGIIVAVASTLSLAAGNNIRRSALAYFTVAVLVILLCIVCYIVLHRSELMRYFVGREKKEQMTPSSSSSVISGMYENDPTIKENYGVWFVWKQIYPQALSVCFVYTVTLSLMPSIISNIESVNKSNGSDWSNKYFASLVCFLLFNCGDFAGRVAAGNFLIVKGTGIGLPLLCFLRVIFIPLFLFCNYQPRNYIPVYFNDDCLPIIVNLLFSTSNGYLTALCMMYGPQQVPEEYQERAGVIMQLSLSVGLCFGAGLSYALVAIV